MYLYRAFLSDNEWNSHGAVPCIVHGIFEYDGPLLFSYILFVLFLYILF